jgi:hypothetical protein
MNVCVCVVTHVHRQENECTCVQSTQVSPSTAH